MNGKTNKDKKKEFDALFKLLYLAMKNITAKWIGKPFNWALIMSQLMIMYPERLVYEDLV